MTKRPASQELSHNPFLAKNYTHLRLCGEQDFLPTQSLALSILQDRSLAQYVRHVTLNYRHWSFFPPSSLPYTASTPEDVEKERIFKSAIEEQKWSDEEGEELLKRLMTITSPGFNKKSSHQLFPDAIVALLLPLLPNVEKWTIGDISNPRYVGKAVQRAKDGVFGKIEVRDVEIMANTMFSDAAWADYDFPSFKILANLPNLQKIEGKGIGGIGIEDAGTYYEIPRQASTVKEILLRDCELGGYCLSRIIDFSKGLESFRYRFGGRSGDGGTAVVYTPGLAKALERHRLGLKRLDLDIDSLISSSLEQEKEDWLVELKEQVESEANNEENEEEDGEDGDSATLGSQESDVSKEKWDKKTEVEPYFPNLTYLRIGIKLAMRFVELSGRNTLAEWLPAGLEELEFLGYRAEDSDIFAAQVDEVMQRQKELIPNLKVVGGVEEYIENGKELDNEDDFVASDDEGNGGNDGEDVSGGQDVEEVEPVEVEAAEDGSTGEDAKSANQTT